MKRPFVFIIPLLVLGFAGCKKMEDTSRSLTITNEESATMIGGALASGSNGLASLTSDMSSTSQTLYSNNNGCGAMRMDTLHCKSEAGAPIIYDLTCKISSKLNCNTNNLPDNVSSSMTFGGNYSGPKLSCSGSGSANIKVAGLSPASTNYILNGQLRNLSSFKLKADTTRSGTIAIDITVTNLALSKVTATGPSIITGGAAAVTITGNSPKKGAFLFEGAITFNGNNDASLKLGNNSYAVNLASGAVVKK